MNKCANCHQGGGSGPGAFAASGIQLAFQSFDALGATTINTRSLDGHSSGSGPQNTTEINEISENYVSGLAAIENCAVQNGTELEEVQEGANSIKFQSRAINPNLDRPVQVTWNLRDHYLSGPNYDPSLYGTIEITADVQIFQRPGIINYVVSNPRVVTNTTDLHITSLLFKLNGRPTPAQRSFFLIDKNIRAWNANHPDFNRADPDPNTDVNEYEYQARLISGGALVMLGEVRTTDVLSLTLGGIEQITLPPPTPDPAVSFGVTTMSVVEDYRIIDIPINLDAPSSEVTFAEVVFGADTTIKDECCRMTQNDDGQQIFVRHFDRDIQDFDQIPAQKLNSRVNFDTVQNRGRYLITFKEGETTQNLRIKIVEDQRDELDEILHLRIDPNRLTKLRPAAINQDFRLTIQDDDVPLNLNSESYTDLLSDGGLLQAECLRCHNSVLNRGGYDITHYELMVNRAILVPGNPQSSLMFRRMDANTPGLLPMPLTGLINPLDRARVSSWILNGAPNN
jgi:hypothetical protein